MVPDYGPTYRQLYDRLKNDVGSGTYTPDDRLPSERELSQRYGCGRQVVRQALRLLQQDGVIDTRRGSGSYVRAAPIKSRDIYPALGVIVPGLDVVLCSGLLTGVVQRARASGFATVVDFHQDSPAEFNLALKRMLGHKVAAVLLVLPRDFGRFNPEILEVKDVPFVLLLRDDPKVICDKVIIDNVAVGELATRSLIQHGCRELVFLGPLDYGTAWNRLRGFRQALQDAGIPYRAENVLDTSRSRLRPPEQAIKCMEQMIQEGRPFDGIFAFNDTHAEAAVTVLHARGIPVPQRVAVIGADDREFGQTCIVPLTTIRFKTIHAGSAAAGMALQRLERPVGKPSVLSIDTKIIARASCPAPSDAVHTRPTSDAREKAVLQDHAVNYSVGVQHTPSFAKGDWK